MTTVIICSVNRPQILHETVESLLRQTVQPDLVILSLCDADSVFPITTGIFGVTCVFGSKGLTAQRNRAIEALNSPYALYLDDDVELAADYIESMERAFVSDSSLVAASGRIVADGTITGLGVSRAEALRAIGDNNGNCHGLTPVSDLYGCNIFVRADILRQVRFDDRLPLYGWLEDLDFRVRCEKHGRLVRNETALVAHLGTPSGRTADIRLGYSKVANPWYLWRKAVLPSLTRVILQYWLKTTIANVARAVMGSQLTRKKFRKRLLGNLLAYRDLALGRLDPLNILRIEGGTESLAPEGRRSEQDVENEVYSPSTEP